MGNQENQTTGITPFGDGSQKGHSWENREMIPNKPETKDMKGNEGSQALPDSSHTAKFGGDENKDKSLLDQAKSAASDTYDSVSETAASAIDEKKAGFASGLTSVADSVRKAGDTLNKGQDKNVVTEYSARYAGTAADKMEQAANYFERTDLRGFARDIETYARANPVVFLGGAFTLGILAARFLKSSPPLSTGAGQYIHGNDMPDRALRASAGKA